MPPTRSGYVIGWQDVERWNSGGLSSASCSSSELGRKAEGDTSKKLARTTICACVVPAASVGVSCSDADPTGHSLEAINEALQKLTDKYQCRTKVAENDNRDSDVSSGDEQRVICSCCTCACIRSLKVVAVLNAGTPSTSRAKDDYLPLIQATAVGVWWQDDLKPGQSKHDGSSDLHKDDDADTMFRELIWYEQLKSLGHYKLDGTVPSDLNHVVGFRRTLMRLSESPNIAKELGDLLDKRRIPFVNGPDSGTSNLARSTDEIESNNELDIPLSFQQRLMSKAQNLSLTVIHFNNRYLQASPGSPILSQTPSLFALLCLIHYIRGSTAGVGEMSNDQRNFVPREVKADDHLSCICEIAHAALDGVFGLTVGLFVLTHPDCVQHSVSFLWNAIHGRLLRENIGWLETFPVGFKLNVPLTTNMGREVFLVVSTYEEGLLLALNSHSVQVLIIKILGLIGITLGLSTMLAFVFDAIRLSTIHIRTISATFCKMFRALLYILSQLWKLFRGKKSNPLRNRTDTLEYDYLQLLLGTILFTICLFLFTTFLVYHTFFMVVNLSVSGCALTVWTVYSVVKAFPLGRLLVRLLQPHEFPRTVYFSQDTTRNGSADSDMTARKDVQVSCLVPVAQQTPRVFQIAYGPIFPRILARIPVFIGEVASGKPSSITSSCLNIHLLNDQHCSSKTWTR